MAWQFSAHGMWGTLLACAGLLSTPSAALAGEQADRALAAVRVLVSSGEVPRDAVIKLAFKPGNIAALLGPRLELQKEWEERTGIMISARVIPQQPAIDNLRKNPDIDLTVARTHEFPDLFEQHLIADLTPLLRDFAFRIDSVPPQGYVRPRLQGYFGDKLLAIPADGDVPILYLRRDLLEDPAESSAFRKLHGRDLAPPQTWQEYDQLVSFFHRPQQGLYGTVEQRDPGNGWMYWLQRYITHSAPFGTLFDDQLRPLISSPAGIAATESYVRTVRHSPPEITGEGKDYSYAMPLFMQGKAFASIFTIAGAKLLNAPTSPLRGKFMTAPLPGHLVGKQLVRHNTPIYGNNLVVAAQGAQRKLAFLFSMWLTDPDNSLRTVGVNGGHTDPYRWHHLKDARIRDLYTAQALKVFERAWNLALPPGTGLPHDSDYLAVLDRQLWLAAKGEITPAAAMQHTAQAWEEITERIGRARQLAWYKTFRAGFTDNEVPGSDKR